MVTITIRLIDIWKKSNVVTYSAKIFLEPDYQTVHGMATEQSKWKQRVIQPTKKKELNTWKRHQKSAYSRRNNIKCI